MVSLPRVADSAGDRVRAFMRSTLIGSTAATHAQGCVANSEAAICTTNSAIEYTDTGACPAYTPTCNQLPGTCESCLDNAYNLTCALCKGKRVVGQIGVMGLPIQPGVSP